VIEIFDREKFLAAINEAVEIEPGKTAVLTIEMTDRRLPESAPFPAGVRDSLLSSTEDLLSMARDSGIAVIHVLSALRVVEANARAATKFDSGWAAIGESVSPYGPLPDESVQGQDGTFKPDLAVSVTDSDFIIKTKKSLSAFYQTDLDWLLKALGADTVILAGSSTNADILSTAFEASCRGMKVITVAECVASTYGQDLHEVGLQQLGRCQGWVLGMDELAKKLPVSALAAQGGAA